MTVILRRPQITVPAVPIASRRWLSRGLSALVVPVGGVALDLVNKRLLTSGTSTNTVGKYGNAILTDANQESKWITYNKTHGSSTILWFGRLLGSASSNAGLFGVYHNSTNSNPYTSIVFQRNPSVDKVALTWAYGASAGNWRSIPTTSSDITSGEYIFIGTVTTGAQSLRVYNPFNYVEEVTASNADTLNFGSGAPLFVGDNLNARNPNAHTYLAAVFNVALSGVEQSALASNPWQLFEPGCIIIPAGTAASGLPTLTSLGVTNVTSTGATVTVN